MRRRGMRGLPGGGGGNGLPQGGGLITMQGSQAYVNGYPVLNSLARAGQQFAVALNSYETLTQSLYDSAAYVAAGQTQLTFFQYQIGAGTSVISGGTKTLEDTNMQNAGSLPAMQAYIVTSIEVEFQAGVSSATPSINAASQPSTLGAAAITTQINDSYIFRSTGFLNFNIGSKSYMNEGPLMKFPASNIYNVEGALSNATTPAAALSLADTFGDAIGPAYILSPNNLFLIPTMNFNVTLNWQTVQAISRQARVFVRLMGQLIRAAQ